MSHYQKAEQRHGFRLENRFFKDVAKFKYLGTTLANKIYKTIIPPLVLDGSETWSLTVGEEHIVKMSTGL
jgi:hypothetical protein